MPTSQELDVQQLRLECLRLSINVPGDGAVREHLERANSYADFVLAGKTPDGPRDSTD